MVREVVTLLVLSKGRYTTRADLTSRYPKTPFGMTLTWPENPLRWPGFPRSFGRQKVDKTQRKATRNRVQFTNDDSAIKTLWLMMICNIEDKRAAKRAKQGKRSAATSGRLIERTKVTNWKQAINQMSVAFPDRFEAYL